MLTPDESIQPDDNNTLDGTFQMNSTQREFPRNYLSESIDLGNWSEVEAIYTELNEREINSPAELEQWLLDRSEFSSALAEEATSRDVKRTRFTNDDDIKQAYLSFIRDVWEKAQEWNFKLDVKYTNSSDRAGLDQDHYSVMDRSVANSVAIFREENVPLFTQDTERRTEYDEIIGAMSVEIGGEELTMQQARVKLEDSDRSVREEAWKKIFEQWDSAHDELDQLYDRMVKLRTEIAQNANESNYMEYAFKSKERFDYTPADCEVMHASVEKVVVPLARKIVEQRKDALGIPSVRPWDIDVDPEGNQPLAPYKGADQLISGVTAIMERVDPELAAYISEMEENGEFDLSSRKGKAPGGYMASFDEKRRPFVFMNEANTQQDVMTMLHEAGHCFHTIECREQPLQAYRDYPMEFAEVASMANELFGIDKLDEFYSEEDANRARVEHLKDIVLFLPYCMQVDAFQHFVYQNPDASSEERDAEWKRLSDRFDIGVDWSGFEELEESGWHYKAHIFTAPFYYIEYGIAQLGALQLWDNYKQDPEKTIAEYRNALSLGGSKPVPELFEAAGIKFDFSESMVQRLMDQLSAEI